jgi:hypothetical protein
LQPNQNNNNYKIKFLKLKLNILKIKGENVVILSNHQTEADPQVFYYYIYI